MDYYDPYGNYWHYDNYHYTYNTGIHTYDEILSNEKKEEVRPGDGDKVKVTIEGTYSEGAGGKYVQRQRHQGHVLLQEQDQVEVIEKARPKLKVGDVVNPNHYVPRLPDPYLRHVSEAYPIDWEEPAIGTVLVMKKDRFGGEVRTAVRTLSKTWSPYGTKPVWVQSQPGVTPRSSGDHGVTHYYSDSLRRLVLGTNSGPWTVVYLGEEK